MEWIGYVAASLVFCTFYMRTMVPLRWTAIASNIAFITYAVNLHLWPILILHGLLLPLNLLRLRELYRMLAGLRAGTAGPITIEHLLVHGVREQCEAGQVLFRKNDPGDYAYYVTSGEIEIPEQGIRLGKGDLFGEIAIFAPNGVRTASAVCTSAATLYRISQRDLVTAFYQQPAFALGLVRLISGRLAENLANAQRALAEVEARTEIKPV